MPSLRSVLNYSESRRAYEMRNATISYTLSDSYTNARMINNIKVVFLQLCPSLTCFLVNSPRELLNFFLSLIVNSSRAISSAFSKYAIATTSNPNSKYATPNYIFILQALPINPAFYHKMTGYLCKRFDHAISNAICSLQTF
jgi:hypothetical protein